MPHKDRAARLDYFKKLNARRRKYCSEVGFRYRARKDVKLKLDLYQQQYRLENRELLRQKGVAYRKTPKGKEAMRQHNKRYKAEKPHIVAAQKAKRRALKANATVDPNGIASFMAKIRNKRLVRCYYCRLLIPGKHAEFDHMIPLSKGGQHSISNLCASCHGCNSNKRARLLENWQPENTQPILPI